MLRAEGHLAVSEADLAQAHSRLRLARAEMKAKLKMGVTREVFLNTSVVEGLALINKVMRKPLDYDYYILDEPQPSRLSSLGVCVTEIPALPSAGSNETRKLRYMESCDCKMLYCFCPGYDTTGKTLWTILRNETTNTEN